MGGGLATLCQSEQPITAALTSLITSFYANQRLSEVGGRPPHLVTLLIASSHTAPFVLQENLSSQNCVKNENLIINARHILPPKDEPLIISRNFVECIAFVSE